MKAKRGGGRPPETYYVYSAIRGNLIDTCTGHKAARKRAGTRFLFVNSKDATLVRGAHGEEVRMRDRETRRAW